LAHVSSPLRLGFSGNNARTIERAQANDNDFAAGAVDALMGSLATHGVRFTSAAHLVCEHGRPPPGELASGPPGVEEGFLRLEPHQLLFGAQMSISGALHPLGLFVISDSQFFSHGGNLCLCFCDERMPGLLHCAFIVLPINSRIRPDEA